MVFALSRLFPPPQPSFRDRKLREKEPSEATAAPSSAAIVSTFRRKWSDVVVVAVIRESGKLKSSGPLEKEASVCEREREEKGKGSRVSTFLWLNGLKPISIMNAMHIACLIANRNGFAVKTETLRNRREKERERKDLVPWVFLRRAAVTQFGRARCCIGEFSPPCLLQGPSKIHVRASERGRTQNISITSISISYCLELAKVHSEHMASRRTLRSRKKTPKTRLSVMVSVEEGNKLNERRQADHARARAAPEEAHL